MVVVAAKVHLKHGDTRHGPVPGAGVVVALELATDAVLLVADVVSARPSLGVVDCVAAGVAVVEPAVVGVVCDQGFFAAVEVDIKVDPGCRDEGGQGEEGGHVLHSDELMRNFVIFLSIEVWCFLVGWCRTLAR